jgi:hypothetical protein
LCTPRAATSERERPADFDEPRIGAIVAEQLIVAWSHQGRVRSEAAFGQG